MTIPEFDELLNNAAGVVNFGPLHGFGGKGADEVFAELPEAVQSLYRRWNLPVAILAGRNPGPIVRQYASACGLDVEWDLERLKS